MSYSGRTLVRSVQHGTDWSKKLPRKLVRALGPMESIDALLEKPTWSVRALLPANQPPSATTASDSLNDSSTTPSQPAPTSADAEITPTTLHHLLRLSALPLPASPAAEARLLSDLRSQVHFVKHLQSVDTINVAPLVSIRDETDAARAEQTVSLQEMEPWLAHEEQVGRNGTVRRPRTDVEAAERQKRYDAALEADERRFLGAEPFVGEDLKPSGCEAGRRWGGYYVVRKKAKKGEMKEEGKQGGEKAGEAVQEDGTAR